MPDNGGIIEFIDDVGETIARTAGAPFYYLGRLIGQNVEPETVQRMTEIARRGPAELLTETAGTVAMLNPQLAIVGGTQAAIDVASGRTSMGFLSSIGRAIGGVARFAGRALGILPPAAQTLPSPGIVGRTVRTVAPVAAGAALGAAGVAALSESEQAMVRMGGNGRQTTITTVTTIDNQTGQAVSRKVLRGSPYLMNRDLVVAKRVLRTAGKLGRKFSRKTREPSKMKQLTDAIQDKALRQALGVAGCS